MDVKDLALFREVARRGSFAAVARDWASDPSSVSRVIAALEAELGFRLFQRTTRKLALTEAGEIYLRRVEVISGELERARDDALAVTSGPVGTLRMTATVAFGQRLLIPLVPKFRAAYPNVALDFLLTDTNLDLVAERIDLALRLGPSIAGDYVVSKLVDTAYRVVASPAYLKAKGEPAHPVDLAGHDCLLFAPPQLRARWLFRSPNGALCEVPLKGMIAATGALALLDLALAGQGPALLADRLVDDDIRAGRLVDLFPDYEATPTTFGTAVWLIYPSRSFLPRKVRAMIDFLRTEVG